MQRDFWIRIVDPTRISGPWLAAALLLHPAVVALALALHVVLGGNAPTYAEELRQPAALLGLVFFVFWFGPLPEEIGWRGFALDRLQVRMSALHSSLLLGVIWAFWHVPLFFVRGTFQHGLGVGSFRFWLFLAALPPLSVLITWTYNNTRRSTLAAVLFHFSGNLTGALVAKSDAIAALECLLLMIASVVITAAFGPARLARSAGGD